MQYLIRKQGTKKSAHYWVDKDTLCRLWSTGGMNQNKQWDLFSTTKNHPICTMCKNVYEHQPEQK